MRLIDVFFPKERQKVTERYLRQVLATSICGILLCMSCLAGTTWAWFVVDIDNGANVIDIASVPPEVTITVNGNPLDSSNPNLSAGVNALHIAHNGKTDDLQYKSTLYVTLSVDQEVPRYVTLCADNQYQADVRITTAQDAFLSWTVSWFKPGGATMLAGDLIDLYVEAESEPTEETTAPTEETTAPTEETTAPTEETTAPTEETTAPTEETTAPTEETTAPTEETTAPTEETTAPTEETTAPTEDVTDPTTETTTPAETTTPPTEAATEPDEGAEQPGGTEGEPEETYTEPLESETSDTEEEP